MVKAKSKTEGSVAQLICGIQDAGNGTLATSDCWLHIGVIIDDNPMHGTSVRIKDEESIIHALHSYCMNVIMEILAHGKKIVEIVTTNGKKIVTGDKGDHSLSDCHYLPQLLFAQFGAAFSTIHGKATA